MVYDWENKEKICYRMYIEEKKSLEDIMEHMKQNHKFNPSKRAFQTQFKKWGFPSKQHPAHKNAALVQRVKELWDCNTSQRDMLQTLNDEGFEIKERELMRVRAKNRWLLRVPNGMKSKKKTTDQDVLSQLQQALYPEDKSVNVVAGDETLEDTLIQTQVVKSSLPASPPLSPEVMKKRQERFLKLQAESAERWATRKRRRRTRGWAGLPADPPGPPRFPSETTIDESKAFLSLNNRLYRDIRSRFQRICEDADIIKKTLAGPERWEAAKDRLIQESPHLQSVFWINEENQDAKKLALDVVCSDVTKRMRTLERRMTIAEAKNALGVNPEESRDLRNAFYQVLKADHFTSKLEAGEDHWKELKNQWINGSELLQKILAPNEPESRHRDKIKAMEVLCRDVMKRLRDDQTKRDPTRKKKTAVGYSNSETLTQFDTSLDTSFQPRPDVSLIRSIERQPSSQIHSVVTQPISSIQPNSDHTDIKSKTRQSPLHLEAQPHGKVLVDNNDLQIDPSLLLATNDPSIIGHDVGNQFSDQLFDDHYNTQSMPSNFTSPTSFVVYFRVHPASEFQTDTTLWATTVNEMSIDELKQKAMAKFPGTLAMRLEGVIKSAHSTINDITIPINQNGELEAYLNTIQGLRPIFSVQLLNTWKPNTKM